MIEYLDDAIDDDYMPDEEEIVEAFMNGTPLCECGERMQPIDDSDIVKCPLCGGTWDIIEYATIGPYSEYLSYLIEEYKPEGCRNCNPAWPKCKTSCTMYDE